MRDASAPELLRVQGVVARFGRDCTCIEDDLLERRVPGLVARIFQLSGFAVAAIPCI
jgi:hypothetical protein